jgi:hypothetical protein
METTGMKVFKLAMWKKGIYNLYRYRCNASGLVVYVEFFNKDPEIRKAMGRWSECPNLNVLKRIQTSLPTLAVS